MSTHSKHTKLTKFTANRFHNVECSFVGAPCNFIKSTVFTIIDKISNLRILYFEARHKEEESERFEIDVAKNTIHAVSILGGSTTEVYQGTTPDIDEKMLSQNFDAVFVNGNHFSAQAQIVFLYPGKEQSLIKRVKELNNIKLLIDCGVGQLPDEILKEYPSYSQLPMIYMNETDRVVKFVKGILDEETKIPLRGLVLTGGKSIRMGRDKANLDYYGIPQWKHTYQLLSEVCDEVMVSVNEKTQLDSYENEILIQDEFLGLGPLGGILTAFKKYPNSSFLVLACDLPLVDLELLQTLLKNRDRAAIATSFKGDNEEGFPEPLIAIWEPKSYPRLLEFLAIGYSCPRKVLINSKTKVIPADDIRKLSNANTIEEFETLSKEIKHPH